MGRNSVWDVPLSADPLRRGHSRAGGGRRAACVEPRLGLTRTGEVAWELAELLPQVGLGPV